MLDQCTYLASAVVRDIALNDGAQRAPTVETVFAITDHSDFKKMLTDGTSELDLKIGAINEDKMFVFFMIRVVGNPAGDSTGVSTVLDEKPSRAFLPQIKAILKGIEPYLESPILANVVETQHQFLMAL